MALNSAKWRNWIVSINLVLSQTSLDWCTWLASCGTFYTFFSNSFISMWLITIFPRTSIPHITHFFCSLHIKGHFLTPPVVNIPASCLTETVTADIKSALTPFPSKSALTPFLSKSLSPPSLSPCPSPIPGFSLLLKNKCLGNFIPFSYSTYSASFLLILQGPFSESKSCWTIFYYIKAKLKLILLIPAITF